MICSFECVSVRVPFTTDRAVISLNPSLTASVKPSGVSKLFHRNYMCLELIPVKTVPYIK